MNTKVDINEVTCAGCGLPMIGEFKDLDADGKPRSRCWHCRVSQFRVKTREVGTDNVDPSFSGWLLDHPFSIALFAIAFGVAVFLFVRAIA